MKPIIISSSPSCRAGVCRCRLLRDARTRRPESHGGGDAETSCRLPRGHDEAVTTAVQVGARCRALSWLGADFNSPCTRDRSREARSVAAQRAIATGPRHPGEDTEEAERARGARGRATKSARAAQLAGERSSPPTSSTGDARGLGRRAAAVGRHRSCRRGGGEQTRVSLDHDDPTAPIDQTSPAQVDAGRPWRRARRRRRHRSPPTAAKMG
jgi:hypothetical protein